MSEASGDEKHTALVCDDDDLARAVLRQSAAAAGFEVVDEALNVPEALALVRLHRPDLVLIRHELPGILGAEATRELRALEDPPEVVLVSPDPQAMHLALSVGAFGAVSPEDPDAVIEVLESLLDQVETGERRTGTERRSGTDRREEQDWSKVFSQRRGDDERRKSVRRSSDRDGEPPA